MQGTPRRWGRQTVTRTTPVGHGGAVAAPRKASVDAALTMLEKGGNAVDAAVAGALVSEVVEPMETGLAGSGHMLISQDDTVICLDFSTRAPLAARPDMFEIDDSLSSGNASIGLSNVAGSKDTVGPLASGVPGNIAGLIQAQEQYGQLDRTEVFAPAVRAAYDGFGIDEYYTLAVLARLDNIRRDPGLRSTFLPDGNVQLPPFTGTGLRGPAYKVRQPNLGRTLEILGEQGAKAFYGGDLGQAFIETVRENGGIITEDDLRAYRTTLSEAASVRLRDTVAWASPGPTGGLTELEMLAILAQWGPQELAFGSAERLRVTAEAGFHAFADRYHWLGDPEFVPVPAAGLLAAQYTERIAKDIRRGKEVPRPASGKPPWQEYARQEVHDPWPYDPRTESRRSWPEADVSPTVGGTSHISVIDASGVGVSCTHTLSQPFGNNILCERTGLVMNAGMGWFNAEPGVANSIAPGKRPVCNMGAMMLTRNGTVTASLGAPGGRRIMHAVAQVAWHLLEYGLPVQDALDAPRVDSSTSRVFISDQVPSEHIATLRESGTPVVEIEEEFFPYLFEFARPMAVTRSPGGELAAGIDAGTRGYTAAL